jgi:predicted SnoaL-like aldol condensation-catalyzing enzyme
MSNKLDNAVGLYLKGIRDGDTTAIERYTGDRYTQHNTHVKDGKAGFAEFFKEFVLRNPKRDIQVLRSFEDEDMVFLHVYQSLNDGAAKWVTLDFFDTDNNDKLIEHWDVISEFSESNSGGHSSISGGFQVSDLDKTEENKSMIRLMIQDLYIDRTGLDSLNKYISADQFVRHSANTMDGRQALHSFLSDPDCPLKYQEVVLCIGSGNYVATLSRATLNGEAHAQADLFRIENDKVVEHWDASEKIPPREEWLNAGKF